jgi:hypothetical protein
MLGGGTEMAEWPGRLPEVEVCDGLHVFAKSCSSVADRDLMFGAAVDQEKVALMSVLP